VDSIRVAHAAGKSANKFNQTNPPDTSAGFFNAIVARTLQKNFSGVAKKQHP
jgi:hypothetical protein